MDLYTSYFNAKSFDRQIEIDASIVANLRNENFKKVYVFTEEDCNLNKRYDFSKDRLVEIKISRIPTYKDWIDFTVWNKSEISIFCNSDISFDDSINFSKKHILKEKSVLCLSLHEKERPWWSQDTWGLSLDNAKNISFLSDLNIEIGNVRCDNKFAYYFSFNEWDIYNPCHSIKSYHKHRSDIRSYSKKDPVNLENIALVFPCENEPSKIMYSFVPLSLKNVVGIEIAPYMIEGMEKEDFDLFENKMNFYKDF